MENNNDASDINQSEYIEDINNYQTILQRFTGNLLKKMQVEHIRNNITTAYDNYPLDYEENNNNNEVETIDEINKEISKVPKKEKVKEMKVDIYKCDRCNYETKSKARFIRHLNRKTPCKAKYKKIEIAEIKHKYNLFSKINYDKPSRVIMIDSAKYPEDKSKYHICQYCNLEFDNPHDFKTHKCDVKNSLTNLQLLEFDKVKLIHLVQKLCTDMSILRHNHGILLKDNILAHKMIDQYDKILSKNNIPFNYTS